MTTMTKHDLPTLYQQVIHSSRYARYIPEQHRRETWEETVDRLVSYLKTKTPTWVNHPRRMFNHYQEIKKIKLLLASKRSEFLAVTGRRRVGKTFLI